MKDWIDDKVGVEKLYLDLQNPRVPKHEHVGVLYPQKSSFSPENSPPLCPFLRGAGLSTRVG